MSDDRIEIPKLMTPPDALEYLARGELPPVSVARIKLVPARPQLTLIQGGKR